MIKSLCTICMLLIFSSVGDASEQDMRKVHFTAKDNVDIAAWYQYPAGSTAKVPVIILIHQGGSSKEEWTNLLIWNALLEQGYALLAYDIRQHGESTVDKDDIMDLFNNPKRAPLDLFAAIEFIKADDRIDPARIAIIGASVGANLAMVAASSQDYTVKTVVAMSGKVAAAQNLSGTTKPIQPKNAFLIASEKEQGGLRKKWAEEWYDVTARSRKIYIADGKQHGSFILSDVPKLNGQIIEWLNKTL